jgi:GcrA cell cycle regulator
MSNEQQATKSKFANRHTPWTEERIAKLTRLWNVEKLTVGQIVRVMGITRNSILGKVRRLNLDSRGSPIKPRKTKVERLPGAKKGFKAIIPSVDTLVKLNQPVARPIIKPRPVVPTCHWPFGMPKEEGFHFCGKPAVEGRPYCQEHVDIAYVRARDKYEDVA